MWQDGVPIASKFHTEYMKNIYSYWVSLRSMFIQEMYHGEILSGLKKKCSTVKEMYRECLGASQHVSMACLIALEGSQ